MTNSLRDLRNKLLEQFLDFLWRQWTSLGVPGNFASAGDWVIDPEALVLITTHVGRHDARLLDLAIDWLHSYGRSINLQRLGRIHGQWPNADELVLSAIAEILAEQSTMRKWKSLPEKHFLPESDEPLFISLNDTAPPAFGDPDPRFKHFRLLRPKWEPRGACQAPRSDRASNLLCTLRAFFGVNARAEIMTWLLTHQSGHPAAIAKATGYFSKSIQSTLNEMEQSGQIRSTREGREKKFWVQSENWNFFATWNHPQGFPRWINWPPIFHFVKRTLQLLEEVESPHASVHLRAIQQRGFLDEIAPALRESGLRFGMVSNRDFTGSQLTKAVIQDVEKLIHLLETDFLKETS
jgi:hypothetical protein